MQEKEKNILNVNDVICKSETSVGYCALMLAATRNMADENKVKKHLLENGFKIVVTEIGGKSDEEFKIKMNKAVIGACLNEKVIEKKDKDLHALLHAAEEAKKGILINTASTTHLALKIAIARKNGWIAVAAFGESSMHLITGHERCGLGVMHI